MEQCLRQPPADFLSHVGRRPVVHRLLGCGVLEADVNRVHRPLVRSELEVARTGRIEDRFVEAGAADGVALEPDERREVQTNKQTNKQENPCKMRVRVFRPAKQARTSKSLYFP